MNEFIEIAKEHLPALGLGTYNLNGKAGENAVSTAIRLGYRHIDTAQFYGNEECVGNAVRASGIERKQFFITTKVWPSDFSKQNFFPKVEKSLKLLQTNYIDLLLLHWPTDELSNNKATEYLVECLHKKYTRLVGVSNFSIPQLKTAQKIAPVFCNQVEFNPFVQQAEMVKYCSENNLLLTAYSPLAKGKVDHNKQLALLGEKYGKTANQVTLKWLLQHKNVAAIPKAGSEIHLKENIDVFDFELSKEDKKSIELIH